MSRQPPEIEGMVSLKVDNLTYRTTVEDLKRTFGKFGEIGDIYIPRDPYTRESRGFAFIRYFDRRDADDAIESMDGRVFDGRELRVSDAKYSRPENSYRPRRSNPRAESSGGGGSYGRRRERSRSRSGRRRSYSRSRSRSPRRNRGRHASRSPRAGSRGRSRSKSPRAAPAGSRSRSPHKNQRSSSRGSRRNKPVSESPARSHSRSKSPPPKVSSLNRSPRRSRSGSRGPQQNPPNRSPRRIDDVAPQKSRSSNEFVQQERARSGSLSSGEARSRSHSPAQRFASPSPVNVAASPGDDDGRASRSPGEMRSGSESPVQQRFKRDRSRSTS